MSWLVFSYSLPAKFNTSSRVRLWRQLRKTGAISPKAGVYVLPYTEDCIDAMQWLAAEVEQEQGAALVMKVQQFENLADDTLVEAFRAKRQEEYQALEAEIKAVESLIRDSLHSLDRLQVQKQIGKLHKKVEQLAKLDYFKSVDKSRLMDQLQGLKKTLLSVQLILMILLNMVQLNEVVLRKMKEEPPRLRCEETVYQKLLPSPEES